MEQVDHITFSASVAAAGTQQVRYVTERCVFELTSDGLELIEPAPGIDLQPQVFDLLPFRPITDNIEAMDASGSPAADS